MNGLRRGARHLIFRLDSLRDSMNSERQGPRRVIIGALLSMNWLRARQEDWRNYRRLSAREKHLLLLAMLLLPLVVVVHRALGLRRTRLALDTIGPTIGCSAQSAPECARLVWSVSRIVGIASRRCVLTPTCLQQSLFLHWWLARLGIASSLRIGVRKRNGMLEAHAWVEFLGRALNDPPDVTEQFAPFDSEPARASESGS